MAEPEKTSYFWKFIAPKVREFRLIAEKLKYFCNHVTSFHGKKYYSSVPHTAYRRRQFLKRRSWFSKQYHHFRRNWYRFENNIVSYLKFPEILLSDTNLSSGFPVVEAISFYKKHARPEIESFLRICGTLLYTNALNRCFTKRLTTQLEVVMNGVNKPLQNLSMLGNPPSQC